MLHEALNDRAAAGSPVKFWLRDDDAIEPSEQLDHLLEVTQKFFVPLTLAVIPAGTGAALAQRLDTADHVSIAVHGWSHTSHAYANEKKQELGNHRPQGVTLAELQLGFKRLSELYPTRFVPLLVPPWNRISPEIIAQLSGLGFEGVSVFGDEQATPIVSINTHVDIIDWKGNRGGRAIEELAFELAASVQSGRSFIGILTHHLVHDERAWQFLEEMFDAVSGHPGVQWVSVNELQHSGE